MPGSPALYFQRVPFGSDAAESFADLLAVVQKVMVQAGLTDIVVAPQADSVSGRTPNSHAAVAFVGGSAKGTIAVVMVAGDDAVAVRKELVSGLEAVHFL